MVIRHFDFRSISVAEPGYNPELIVDPDAVFPLQVALQRLQTIAWRRLQVLQRLRPVQLIKLPQCRFDDRRRVPFAFPRDV
jgi:hypothetical protein